MQGDGSGHHGIEDAFWNFVHRAIFAFVEDGGVGHQMADVAKEQQRAAVQFDGLAVFAGVLAVCVQATCEGLATFFNGLSQRAFDDAQPVAVGQHFVVRIHHGHGVFQVEDGGQGSFHDQVAHASRVGRTDGRAAVDLQVEVQTVVHQQH